MDSKMQEAKEAIEKALSDVIRYSDDKDLTLGAEIGIQALDILTAEPEPCEGHDEINNCLHCGGRAEIVHGMQDGWIACSKCGAAGPRRSSDEDAISAWNRSYASKVADKRAEEMREQLTKMIYLAERYWWHASARPTDNPGMRKEIDDAKVILAATEPKP